MAWEEVSRNHIESWLILNTNIIIPFIEETQTAFSPLEIQQKFPNLSDVAVEGVLNKLISEEKLNFLQPKDGNQFSLWIRTDVMHERGLSMKSAIDEYYEMSGRNLDPKLDQTPSPSNRSLEAENRPLNRLKLNPSENRDVTKVLFSLANSVTANFKLSEEVKTAFWEVIKTYTKLGHAFLELVEERNAIIEEGGNPISFFAPRDALSMVWHIASLKRIYESQTLDPLIEDNIIRLIDAIILKGGRSSYEINENLNSWFDHWQKGESIFIQEAQLH